MYFERVNPIIPMIHKDRYFTWASDDNVSPARVCLRSAMRALSAAMSAEFGEIADVLYARTRHLLEVQNVQGSTGVPWMTRPKSPRNWIDYELVQAWLLVSHYEFLRRFEQEALLTAGHAFTLLQLSGIFNVDMQQTLVSSPGELSAGPSSTIQAFHNGNWVQVEEMRRTIWTAFVLDRLSSMLNHRPPMLHEKAVSSILSQ